MDNKRQTLLIVGEDQRGEDLYKGSLENDYRTIVVKLGAQAIEYAKIYLPDLILLNATIEDMEKNEFCFRLSADPLTFHIPVLVTATLEEATDIYSGAPNVMDFIIASLNPEIVKIRIRNYMELKQYRDLNRKTTIIDSLTGIANRYFLEELLSREWRRAVRYQAPQSMIIGDIDFFAAYNEKEGRIAGDECLCRVASTITRCVKREIDCVARFGEDEFACLLPETDINGAALVAFKIKDAVEDLNIFHPASPIADHITMSLGVATVKPAARLSPNRLIELAEHNLAEARQQGHNQIKSGQR